APVRGRPLPRGARRDRQGAGAPRPGPPRRRLGRRAGAGLRGRDRLRLSAPRHGRQPRVLPAPEARRRGALARQARGPRRGGDPGMSTNTRATTVGIMARPDLKEAGATLRALVEWLTARRVPVCMDEATAILGGADLADGCRVTSAREVARSAGAL